jgi:N6-adenosine-specific RNA methylase IME4/ParB-like chromosome segregation protein Spo0J
MKSFHPLANIFPLIEGAEFDELVADIVAHGVLEPIWIYEGQIIDGRNRYRAAELAGVDCPMREYIGDDPVSFVVSLNLKRRHLDESQRAMVAAKLATLGQGARTDLSPIGEMSQAAAAELLNVGKRSVERAREIIDDGATELVAAVERGQVSVSAAADVASKPKDEQRQIVARGEREILEAAKAIRAERATARLRERESDIQAQREAIARGEVRAGIGPFDVIVIDPPWPYGTEYSPYWRGACPYPELPIEEIAALSVAACAADDCVLWLWTTHKFMRHSFALLDRWGFEEKAIGTWAKDRIGLGSWLRSQSEFFIMAVRGRPVINLTNQTTVLNAKLREHSRKPDEFYAMVESLCLGVRRYEWFGREAREGWFVGGNDTERFDQAVALRRVSS